MADQISDAVLDAVLKDDPTGPRGVRSARHHGHLALSRVKSPPRPTSTCRSSLARSSPTSVSPTRRMGSTAKTCGVLNVIQAQSPDIAMGVDTGGAGDQGSDVRLCLR